jgi:hypothetical protein
MIPFRTRRLPRLVSLMLACAFVLLAGSHAFAQTDTGRISGVVRDPAGAVINGATVTAQLPTVSGAQPLPTGFAAFVNVPGGGASRNVRRPDLIPGINPYLNNDRALLNPAAFAIPTAGVRQPSAKRSARAGLSAGGLELQQADSDYRVRQARIPHGDFQPLQSGELRPALFDPERRAPDARLQHDGQRLRARLRAAARTGLHAVGRGLDLRPSSTDRRAHRRPRHEPASPVRASAHFLTFQSSDRNEGAGARVRPPSLC